MKDLYEIVGFTKQAHWEWQERQKSILDHWLLLESIMIEWREDHPSMSLKKLYHQIQPDFIGINGFIDYSMANGFEAIPYKKAPKTTFSEGTKHYPNLLIDLNINRINQVFVSDTTYYRIGEKWYYITFVMDLYSRRIIGWHVSDSLFAEANCQALQMALKTRGIEKFNFDTCHHSDRGSQYNSNVYTDMLDAAEIKISMGQIVYDNIIMERCHQTIKGEYLKHRNIKTLQDLIYHVEKDVNLYNTKRPHIALGMKSPIEFERAIFNVPLSQRTMLKVFISEQSKRKSKFAYPVPNQAQLRLPFD